jgi:hypothetical protein
MRDPLLAQRSSPISRPARPVRIRVRERTPQPRPRSTRSCAKTWGRPSTAFALRTAMSTMQVSCRRLQPPSYSPRAGPGSDRHPREPATRPRRAPQRPRSPRSERPSPDPRRDCSGRAAGVSRDAVLAPATRPLRAPRPCPPTRSLARAKGPAAAETRWSDVPLPSRMDTSGEGVAAAFTWPSRKGRAVRSLCAERPSVGEDADRRSRGRLAPVAAVQAA